MNKKLLITGLAILAGLSTFTATNAYFDGHPGHWGVKARSQGMHFQNMNQEKYDEFRDIVLKYEDVEKFKEAIKERYENRKAEREDFRKKITRNVEKIENGVVLIITSDDPELVEKIQSREVKAPKREDVTRVVEEIDDGVKITMTSDNDELVERMQNHDRGQGMFRGRGNKLGKVEGNFSGRFAKFRERMAKRFGWNK